MSEENHLIMLPGPTNVADRVTRALTKPIIAHRGPEFRALYEGILENLKYLFKTNHDVFVLTSSGTGAVECAIGNVVDTGDKVIVPVFGAFSERLKEKIIRYGGNPVEIRVDWGRAPTAKQIEDCVKHEQDVKTIAVVYNETSTGVTVRDLPKIGKITENNNILLMVDAISILGGDRLPIDDWNVDLCVTGSQKCLACPPGLSMISVSEKAWKSIETKKANSFYFDLLSIRDFASRGQTPFTPALPLFYALDEALKMIREEGLEKRYKRHKVCAEAFYAGFEALGLKPFPAEDVRSNTVIALNAPAGVEVAEVRQNLQRRYKVVVGGGMGKMKHQIFRVGCMGIISEAEVLTTLNAFENALADVNYPVTMGAGIESARKAFNS